MRESPETWGHCSRSQCLWPRGPVFRLPGLPCARPWCAASASLSVSFSPAMGKGAPYSQFSARAASSTKCLITEGVVSSGAAPWMMEFLISICPAVPCHPPLRCHPTPDATDPETVQLLIVSMNSLFSFLRLSLLSLFSFQSTCLKDREVGTVTSGPVGCKGSPTRYI